MNIHACISYVLWLLINVLYFYSEYDFIFRFLKRKPNLRNLLVYVFTASLFTVFELMIDLPALLLLIGHIAILYLFMTCSIQCKRFEAVTPLVIIFSLNTVLEGVSAVISRWIVQRGSGPFWEDLQQLSLTVVLSLSFFLILRYVAGWHKSSAGQSVTPYLYLLLLPCTFIVWVVRFGFGLDNTNLTDAEYPFSGLPLIWALIAIIGAAITFFMILKVFEKIMMLSQQETEKALLDNQLREQKIHLAEAQKRDEQLSSFQHDIDNHLSVLSGLLKERKYSDAEQYFQKLQTASMALCRNIRTGNAVLDILLREKIGYAEQNQISVSCHAGLPPDLPVDDMDLCIIVSNALDNAIQACAKIADCQPEIDITIKVRHQFLLIEITNTAPPMATATLGIGLKNVARSVEKYQGTMEIGTDAGCFRISVLLCLATNISPDTQKK